MATEYINISDDEVEIVDDIITIHYEPEFIDLTNEFSQEAGQWSSNEQPLNRSQSQQQPKSNQQQYTTSPQQQYPKSHQPTYWTAPKPPSQQQQQPKSNKQPYWNHSSQSQEHQPKPAKQPFWNHSSQPQEQEPKSYTQSFWTPPIPQQPKSHQQSFWTPPQPQQYWTSPKPQPPPPKQQYRPPPSPPQQQQQSPPRQQQSSPSPPPPPQQRSPPTPPTSTSTTPPPPPPPPSATATTLAGPPQDSENSEPTPELVLEIKELGNEKYRKNLLDEAVRTYKRALELAKRLGKDHSEVTAMIHFNLAMCYSRLGSFEQAIDECANACKIDENYHKAQHKRAEIYMKLKKFEEAVICYEHICEMETTNQDDVAFLNQARFNAKKLPKKDYLNILGLKCNYTIQDLKRAYRQKALKHHPDRHSHADVVTRRIEEKYFKDVSEAYTFIQKKFCNYNHH